MKTQILFFLGLSFLTLAGCAIENSVESYQPIIDSNSVISQPIETTPAIIEAVKPPFTLTQCIEIALENNPDVVGGGFDVLTSKAQKSIAASHKLPAIGFGTRYTHFSDNQRLIQPRYNGEPGVFGDDVFAGDMVLSMPLFTAGRIENEIKATDLLSQSASHSLARTRHELVFNLSQVYYNILAQRHIIESQKFSKKALEEHKKRVSNLIDMQRAAKVDLLRTEVRLADIEQGLVREKNVMSILRRVLVNFMGFSKPGQEMNIVGELQLTAVDAKLHESIFRAYSQRTDYLSAEKQVQAQEKRLDIVRAGRWPTISSVASYGLRSAVNPDSRPSRADSSDDVGFVGISLNIPLYEGGAISARVRKERSKLNSMRQQLRKLKLQIDLDVETAILNINSSNERVDATEKSIEQAKESLRIERSKYDLGKGSITDVLDAQSALLITQTIYYRALSDYNTAVAQWHLAIGVGK